MFSLPGATWVRFVIWSVLGVIVYLVYGARHSKLAMADAVAAPAE
jgi:hypothetical protein